MAVVISRLCFAPLLVLLSWIFLHRLRQIRPTKGCRLHREVKRLRHTAGTWGFASSGKGFASSGKSTIAAADSAESSSTDSDAARWDPANHADSAGRSRHTPGTWGHASSGKSTICTMIPFYVVHVVIVTYPRTIFCVLRPL